ncbi:MAG: acetyl-CoA carboxylase biotin carboxyl carrier protein subunit [Bacteroidales bacterium]|nr:acetyl-CoA carboxylase biotin carboxyl carrier protein subunit [Bacteroidales bacterium]
MQQDPRLEKLNINNSLYTTRLSRKFKNRKMYKTPDPLIVTSFIPGTVLDILVIPGQEVRKGDCLMILEAMKMQNHLKCPRDGKVKRIAVQKGEKVSKGTFLLEME